MLKMEKVQNYDKFPKLDISKFGIRNEEVVKKLEKKLRKCPFCHKPVKLSTHHADDFCVPNMDVSGYDLVVTTWFSIECENRCVDFKRTYNFKFKDNDDFSDYVGPVEMVSEWNGKK